MNIPNKANEDGYFLSPEGMQNLINLVNFLQIGTPKLDIFSPGPLSRADIAKILVEGVIANAEDMDELFQQELINAEDDYRDPDPRTNESNQQ